jgi:hypothetical protein
MAGDGSAGWVRAAYSFSFFLVCAVCLALPRGCPKVSVVETTAVAVTAAPGRGWCGRVAMSRLGVGGPLSWKGEEPRWFACPG